MDDCHSASSLGRRDGHGDQYNYGLIVLHVVFGALATMLFLPLGILLPRYARGLTTSRWWFPSHVGIQLGGLVTGIIAIGVAFYLGGAGGSTHQVLGVILAIAFLVQIALGIFVHWFKAPSHRMKTKSGRGPTNFIHMVLGVLIVLVGWVTAFTGLDDEWGLYAGRGDVGNGWRIAWGVVAGVPLIAYILGLFLIPRQKRMEREKRENMTEMRSFATAT